MLTCEKQQSTCYQRQEVDEVEGPAPTLTLPSLALYSPGILPTAMQVWNHLKHSYYAYLFYPLDTLETKPILAVYKDVVMI